MSRCADHSRPRGCNVAIVASLFLLTMLGAGRAHAQAAPVCTTQVFGNDDFYGISGSSDANVIGVGEQGVILRFDGGTWTSMSTPTNRDLFDVEVVDASTAFAVGDNGTVLQLSGGSWTDVGGFTNRDLFGVWTDASGDAWVAGDRGELWYWNGSTWSDQGAAAGTDNRDLTDIWGDANFVYVMSQRGELYVYDRNAGSWLPRDNLCRQGNNFTDLWGDGSGNLYMVQRENIYRNDGASCPVVAVSSERMVGIYGANGMIFAGGRAGVAMRYDGIVWTESTEAGRDINDVWVSPTGTVYYAGDRGEITTCAPVVPNVVADFALDDCTLGFDGSPVIDAGPNGLDGTTVGGLVVRNDGSLCSAAGLNGSSAYVQVPDTPALDVQDGISIAAWVRHNGGPTDWQTIIAKGDDGFRLHLNGGCAIADALPGNTRYGLSFGLNGGCASADLNSNVVPTPGVWYHVAATYERTVMRIFVNGNFINSASYSVPIANSAFDLLIGENQQQPGRFWNGDIDELTIWDNAISIYDVGDHMNRTRPCTACSAVEFLINHDGNGIHCVDETITVSAVDDLTGTPRTDYGEQVTLDTQTGNGTWTLVSGSGTLVDATADDGLATYDWPLGEDSAQFALSYRQGTASFDIDVYQTSDVRIRDTDTEGLITFRASGFTVTSTPLSNPPPALIAPFAAPQTAGVAFPVYLAAFGQTPTDPACGVIETYDGARDLQIWNDYLNPASGAIAPTVDGLAIAASEAAAGTQSVIFSSGQASVTARYKDAGLLRLNFNDDNVADPDLPNGIRGATAGFVSRPFSFVLSGIEDPGGNPNPAPADAAGPAFVAAGTPFTATVTALDADGDATPNYGREIVPETVTLTATLVSPAGGNNPPISSATGFGAFIAGQATGTDFSWPEVGIVSLTPSVGDGDYLGAGNVVGTPSENVGRFFPDHFTAALNVPALATACGAGSFTYVGEAFGYATAPVVTLTARAADAGVTQNYAGAYFRIDNTSLSNRSYSATSGLLDLSGLPPVAADPAIAPLGGGLATLTFSAGSGLAFTRGAPEPPFDAEISLAIDVFDTDGVAALTNPVTFGAGTGMLFDAGNEMRYGRLRLLNAVGSELVDLNVPMRAEYYGGAGQGFLANVGDACSGGVTLSLGGFTNNLGAGETCAIENGSPGESGIACAAAGPAGLRYREPPVGGDFNLYLRAPGDGNDGSTTVTADVPPWLRYDWDAALAGDENPTGTATFGIYRGEDRRIYTRELY